LVLDIEGRIAQDPIAGREHLRRLLKDGRIVLEPQADGVYLARTEALPPDVPFPRVGHLGPARSVSLIGLGLLLVAVGRKRSTRPSADDLLGG
jgi:hypothetical protein